MLTEINMETQSAPLYHTADLDDALSTKNESRVLTPLRPSNGVVAGNLLEYIDGLCYIQENEATRYSVGPMLGRGGFAKVFKLTTTEKDGKLQSVYAGKIISKSCINRPDKKDKISREIDVHRRMKHENVVQFLKFFEDNENVFIVLEYCGTKTLSNILKVRKRLTEPEARYYLKQIIAGCQHIHSKGVVHRDLKLSNLFINDHMELKIGDFGLSAFIGNANDKKESICGTPNYISPEVILKVGHSYPADVWAMGCIIYALLSGRPPFETQCLKDTYKLISKSRYQEPGAASLHARCIIAKCLRVEPETRPSLKELETDRFLTTGFIPSTIPTSAATITPDFKGYIGGADLENGNDDTVIDTIEYYIKTIDEQEIGAQGGKDLNETFTSTLACAELLAAIKSTLMKIEDMDSKTNPKPTSGDKCIWIAKWVDYSHKYGFGFQLSNDISGACFKDGFSIAINGEESHVGLHDPAALITIECPVTDLQQEYQKKLQVMKYFVKYMDDTLIRGGDGPEEFAQGPSLSDTYMLRWLRTKESIAMCISTGTMQVNFFNDHTKLVVTKVPNGDYKVMYVNTKRQSSVFNLRDIAKHGVVPEIRLRLKYTMMKLAQLLQTAHSSAV